MKTIDDVKEMLSLMPLRGISKIKILVHEQETINRKQQKDVLELTVPMRIYTEVFDLVQPINERLRREAQLDDSETRGMFDIINGHHYDMMAGRIGTRGISAGIESARKMPTEEYKKSVQARQKSKKQNKQREIKSKPKSNGPKWKGRIKALIATGVIVLGAAAIKHGYDSYAERDEGITISHTTRGEEETLSTVQQVSKDFGKRYLEAYNKTYGTDYSSIELITSRPQSLYKVDGKLVTKGDIPGATKKYLENNIGEVEFVTPQYGNSFELIQLITRVKGKEIILGTYDSATGEFVYSAHQLEEVTDENFEEPTLDSLGINSKAVTSATKVILAEGAESKTSVTMRIDDYKKNIDDGLEI